MSKDQQFIKHLHQQIITIILSSLHFMQEIFNKAKTIAILNSFPAEIQSHADFVIIGINPYLTITELPSHLRILLQGNPSSIVNHVIWNEVYQRTLLRQLYQKMMSNGGNKDSIFIRFNGSDPALVGKSIVWSQRTKMLKRINSNGQGFQENSYPIQIQIEGFLQDGGSKKITIDVVNISRLNKQACDKFFHMKQISYSYIFQYLSDFKTMSQKQAFSKSMKSELTYKKGKKSSTNLSMSTQRKNCRPSVHSKCKYNIQQIFTQQLKSKTPERMKKIFQKYESKAINKERSQFKQRKISQSNTQLSTGRKSVKSLLRGEQSIGLGQINLNCLYNQKTNSNLISQIQPVTQRVNICQNSDQIDKYASKQSGRSICKNRQQMLGKIIRQKQAKLVAVQDKFMNQQQNWQKLLDQKEKNHQKQLIEIKNEVSKLLQSYSSKCETFKQQNQHLRAYSEKARKDNQQLTRKLAEVKVQQEYKSKRIKELEDVINKKQAQWGRKVQKQRDRYSKIVKKLKMIQASEYEQKDRSRINEEFIPFRDKQNMSHYLKQSK